MKIEPKLMTQDDLDTLVMLNESHPSEPEYMLLAHIAALNEQLEGVGELVEAAELTLKDYWDSIENDMGAGGVNALCIAIAKVKGVGE